MDFIFNCHISYFVFSHHDKTALCSWKSKQNCAIRIQTKIFEIFNKRSDEVCEKLNFSQIAALRFAYDEEFKNF